VFKKYLYLSVVVHLLALWRVGASLPPAPTGNQDPIILEFKLDQPQINGSVDLAEDQQAENKAITGGRPFIGEKIVEPTPETKPESPDPDPDSTLKKEEPLPFPEKENVEPEEFVQLPSESAPANSGELPLPKETPETDFQSNILATAGLPQSGNRPVLPVEEEKELTPEGGSPSSTTQSESLSETATDETGTDEPAPRPILVHRRTPFYPLVARRKGWAGTVTLQVSLDQNGCVGEVQVHESSGYEILDKEAVKAVGHWRYTPAYRDGNPIACQIRVKITFTLQN
jgi:protein TonB